MEYLLILIIIVMAAGIYMQHHQAIVHSSYLAALEARFKQLADEVKSLAAKVKI